MSLPSSTAVEPWFPQHHTYTYRQCFYIPPLDLVPSTPCMTSFGDEALLRVVCLSSLVPDRSAWLSKDQDALSISILSHTWRMLPLENCLLSWAPLPFGIAIHGIPPLNKLKCACLKSSLYSAPLLPTAIQDLHSHYFIPATIKYVIDYYILPKFFPVSNYSIITNHIDLTH